MATWAVNAVLWCVRLWVPSANGWIGTVRRTTRLHSLMFTVCLFPPPFFFYAFVYISFTSVNIFVCCSSLYGVLCFGLIPPTRPSLIRGPLAQKTAGQITCQPSEPPPVSLPERVDDPKAQNIVKEIKHYQKKWLQHVQRMDTKRLPKQVLQYQPKGRRNIWRPSKRWRDQLHLKDYETWNTPNTSWTWWWWTDAVTQLKLASEFLYLLTSVHKAEDKLPDRQLLKTNPLNTYVYIK